MTEENNKLGTKWMVRYFESLVEMVKETNEKYSSLETKLEEYRTAEKEKLDEVITELKVMQNDVKWRARIANVATGVVTYLAGLVTNYVINSENIPNFFDK